MKPIKIKFNAYRNVNSQAGTIYSTMAVSPALCCGEKRYGGLQPIIMTIYELDTTRPEGGEKEDSTPTATQYRGGEKIAMTILATAYKNPPLVFTAFVTVAPKR